MHYYFNCKPLKWNINKFLNKCNLKITKMKLELYLKYFKTIINNNKNSQRCEKAQKLLNNYRKIGTFYLEYR